LDAGCSTLNGAARTGATTDASSPASPPPSVESSHTYTPLEMHMSDSARGLRALVLPTGVRWLQGATLGLLLVMLAGCGLRGGDDDDLFRSRDRSGPIVLEVQNDNFNDARVYTLWNGQRRRIGTVIGKTENRFEFDHRQGDLRIQVDFLAAGGFTTEPILAWPGEVIHLVIPSYP